MPTPTPRWRCRARTADEDAHRGDAYETYSKTADPQVLSVWSGIPSTPSWRAPSAARDQATVKTANNIVLGFWNELKFRNDGDPNRMGHRKRSQLDSIDLLWDRRTQLAKTGIGNTYDDWAEGEEAPDMVQADLEVRAIPAPW